jgi:hypothetical protein
VSAVQHHQPAGRVSGAEEDPTSASDGPPKAAGRQPVLGVVARNFALQQGAHGGARGSQRGCLIWPWCAKLWLLVGVMSKGLRISYKHSSC